MQGGWGGGDEPQSEALTCEIYEIPIFLMDSATVSLSKLAQSSQILAF